MRFIINTEDGGGEVLDQNFMKINIKLNDGFYVELSKYRTGNKGTENDNSESIDRIIKSFLPVLDNFHISLSRSIGYYQHFSKEEINDILLGKVSVNVLYSKNVNESEDHIVDMSLKDESELMEELNTNVTDPGFKLFIKSAHVVLDS